MYLPSIEDIIKKRNNESFFYFSAINGKGNVKECIGNIEN